LFKPNAIRLIGRAARAGQNTHFLQVIQGLHKRKTPVNSCWGSEPLEGTLILASGPAEIAILASLKPAWLSQKRDY
jgi:hypothetical protein